MHVAFGAVVFRPSDIAVAAIALHYGPRPRQRAVGRGDFVAQDVRIGLVEENSFLDDGLVVLREWNAGLVVGARRLDVAGLDLQRVETSVAVGVEPLADRIAHIGRLFVRREAAAVGIDATRRLDHELRQHERGRRCEHPFHREYAGHHPRHAGRDAFIGGVEPLSAGLLVLQARLQQFLILRFERRFLGQPVLLAGVVAWRAAIRNPAPLAGPVGIFAVVHDLGRCGHRPQHSRCTCQGRDAD